MNITIFAEIGESINEVINKSIGEVRDGYISDIILLAKVSITLYLTIYGYAVLSGKRSVVAPFLISQCYNLGARSLDIARL